MFWRKPPKTPLRVLCIAAFEYVARLDGGTLGARRRLAMAYACDFGGMRDEFYDCRKLDRGQYRALRLALRQLAPENATLRYIQDLRCAERNRPVFTGNRIEDTATVAVYRSRVLEVSLSWLDQIAGSYMDPVKSRALLIVAILAQLADDVLDWKDDLASGQPSYVTALLGSESKPGREARERLRAQAARLRRELFMVAANDTGAVPFAVAGAFIWVFVVTLLGARFPK